MNPGRALKRKNLKEQKGDMQQTMRRLAQELQHAKHKAQQVEQEIMFAYDMVLALTVEKIRESNFQTKGDNGIGSKDTALSLEFMFEAKSMYMLNIDKDVDRKMIILRPTLRPKSIVKDGELDGESDVEKDG